MQRSPTYKQLEASLRLGAFTLRQWAEILVSATAALLFAVYVSPFGATTTVFVSIVVAGAPVALSYGAMAQEWSVVDALRAQWRWLTRPRRRLPGPGANATGYRVVPAPVVREAEEIRRDVRRGETEEGVLWDF